MHVFSDVGLSRLSLVLCVDASEKPKDASEKTKEKKTKEKKPPKEKKFRKVSLHNVFVSAVMDSMHGHPGAFKAIAGFKKTVSKEAMDKFAVDFEPVVTALNESGERTTDDMKILIRNRLKELGIEKHEAFEGFEACPFCLPVSCTDFAPQRPAPFGWCHRWAIALKCRSTPHAQRMKRG